MSFASNMPSRSVQVHRCAETFLDNQSDTVRAALLDTCDELGADPFVDGETKFVFPTPPAMMRIWSDVEHWIVYRLDEQDTVNIYNIGRDGVDRPTFRC